MKTRRLTVKEARLLSHAIESEKLNLEDRGLVLDAEVLDNLCPSKMRVITANLRPGAEIAT